MTIAFAAQIKCASFCPHFGELCADGEAVSYAALRGRAASLMIEMRHHQAIEANLVFEALVNDGVGID